MRHPKLVIPRHSQTHPHACLAWATETLILTHEKERPQLQQIPNFQSYEAERSLKDAGINAQTIYYDKDWAGFADHMLKAVRRGVYPAVIVPSKMEYDYEAGAVRVMNRAFLMCENDGALEFCASESNGGMTVYSYERFRREYDAWTYALKLCLALRPDTTLQVLMTQQP